MLGLRTSRIVVVSGGGSAAIGLGYTPRSPAVPASVTPPRNLRRLNCLACWVLIGTPFQMLVSVTPRTPTRGLFFHRMNRHST